jgi:hypothetical protein
MTIFQTSIMAYNLLVWMMWLTGEEGFKEEEEPNTVRMFLIHVPARLRSQERNKSTRLRRICVRLQGASAGAYQDMRRWMQHRRRAQRQARWWIYFFPAT